MATPIRIATTTSVVNSRLSYALSDAYEDFQTEYELDWNPLGSGAAMNAARKGQADLVIAHDRVGEKAFLAENYGLLRQVAFHNYFIMVGPPNGPISSGSSLQDAFTYINDNLDSVTYVTRGPSGLSGTFVREQQIWRLLLNHTPSDSPYPSSYAPSPGPGIIIGGGGEGMMATLNATADLVAPPGGGVGVNAYTLTDVGTWYAFLNLYDPPSSSPLQALTLGDGTDPWSPNQYVMMTVNPNACGLTPSNINLAGAQDFVNWMFTASGANNARNTVNNFKPDGVNQGFYWNCEALPGDNCLIKFLPPIYVNQIYPDPNVK